MTIKWLYFLVVLLLLLFFIEMMYWYVRHYLHISFVRGLWLWHVEEWDEKKKKKIKRQQRPRRACMHFVLFSSFVSFYPVKKSEIRSLNSGQVKVISSILSVFLFVNNMHAVNKSGRNDGSRHTKRLKNRPVNAGLFCVDFCCAYVWIYVPKKISIRKTFTYHRMIRFIFNFTVYVPQRARNLL